MAKKYYLYELERGERLHPEDLDRKSRFQWACIDAAHRWNLERWGIKKIPWPWTVLFRGQLETAAEVLYKFHAAGLAQQPGFNLVYEDSDWPDDRSDVWCVTPFIIKRTIDRFGMSALNGIIEGMKEVWKRGPLEMFSFRGGVHYGEMFEDILPRCRMGKKEIAEFIVLQYEALKYSRREIKLGDMRRLAKLSKESRRFVMRTCCGTETVGWRRHEIDWEKASLVLNKGAEGIQKVFASEDFESQEFSYRVPVGALWELVWKRVFGRVPKDPLVFTVLDEDGEGALRDAKDLKRQWKHFHRLIRRMNEEYEQDKDHAVYGLRDEHHVLAAKNIATLFGNNAEQWVALHGGGEERPLCQQIHDAGINLTPPRWADKEEIGRALWKHRNNKKEFLEMFCRAGNKGVQLLGQGLKFKEVIRELQAMTYGDPSNPELSKECAQLGISEEDYEEIKDRWERAMKAQQKTGARESIPGVNIEVRGLRVRRLDKQDPAGLFLGNYTECCQHILGAGHSCARHGMESPDGAFFVVEKDGQIIAQSWAWRKGRVLVLDSIEVKRQLVEPVREDVAEAYMELASALVGKLGLDEVRVGSSPRILKDSLMLDEVESVSPPSGIYSDAEKQWKIIVAQEEEVWEWIPGEETELLYLEGGVNIDY